MGEKEAIIVDLDGYMLDTIIVPVDTTGVSPIYVDVFEADSIEPLQIVTGYQVAIRPPEGLHELRFDFVTETWCEALTPEEIEVLRNPPYVPTELDIIGQQLVASELQGLALKADNDLLGSQLVGIDLRLLEGGM